MEDNPVTFLKRVIALTLGLSLVLTAVLYFSGKEAISLDGDKTEDSVTLETPKKGVSSVATKSVSATSPETLIRKAENAPTSISAIISYDNSGFHPSEFRVKAGTSVRFINKSSGTMLISSVYKDGARAYPEFEQRTSVGKGGYFDFNFSKKGSWGFSNINAPNHYGFVIVE